MSGDDSLEVQVTLEEVKGVAGLSEIDTTLLEAAVRHTWRAEGRGSGEVSVTLLDDDAIAELNRTYLGRDGPTDVIAFTLSEGALPMGDVYLGARQAARQAEEYGVSLAEELVRLAVHGTLHVLGYDHPEGAERLESDMFVRQEALVGAVLKAADRG